MNVEVRLTMFKGKERYLGFFTITDKGKFKINWDLTKIRYLIHYLILKKKAIELQKKYSNNKTNITQTISQFCKKYPTINWHSTSECSIDDNTCFTVHSSYPITSNQFHEMVCDYANVTYDSVERGNLEEYSKLLDNKILNNKLYNAHIFIGNNAVKLTNGNYLVKDKNNGSFKFIVTPETIEHYYFCTDSELKKSINVFWNGTPEFMYGTFKMSKSLTPLFYPCDKTNAEHILIKIDVSKDTDFYCPIPKPLYSNFLNQNYFAIIPNGTIIEYDEENL